MKKTKKIKKLLNSVQVNINSDILKWFAKNQTESIRKGQISLSEDLTNQMNILFGEPNIILNLQLKTRIWQIEYNDIMFNISSSKRGTHIELIGYSMEDIIKGKKKEEILEFLQELHNKINL